MTDKSLQCLFWEFRNRRSCRWFPPHLRVTLLVRVWGWGRLASQGTAFVSAPPPGSPRAPCRVNSWVGNHRAERLIIPLPDHPPRSPSGSGDGFGSGLPPPLPLSSVAERVLGFLRAGSSRLGRTSLCEGIKGHKTGPTWLKPEQVWFRVERKSQEVS